MTRIFIIVIAAVKCSRLGLYCSVCLFFWGAQWAEERPIKRWNEMVLGQKRPRPAALMLTAWPSTIKTGAAFYLPWNLWDRQAKTNTNSRWKHLDFTLLDMWEVQICCFVLICLFFCIPINSTKAIHHFLFQPHTINQNNLIYYCWFVHLRVLPCCVQAISWMAAGQGHRNKQVFKLLLIWFDHDSQLHTCCCRSYVQKYDLTCWDMFFIVSFFILNERMWLPLIGKEMSGCGGLVL